MKLPRAVAGILAAGLAVGGIYRFAVLPSLCNLENQRLRSATEQVMELPRLRQAARVRSIIAEIETLPRYCRAHPEMQMIVAANYRMLGRYDEAIVAYRNALEREERPEIYLQLGMTELEAGNRSEAVRDLATAVRFHAPLLQDVAPPYREEVQAAARLHHQHLP